MVFSLFKSHASGSKSLQVMAFVLLSSLLTACGGSSQDRTTDVDDAQSQDDLVPDFVPSPVTSSDPPPAPTLNDEFFLAASNDELGAAVFEDSGLVLLPRRLVSSDLDQSGVIEDLLFFATGERVTQSANWTHRLLVEGDPLSSILRSEFDLFMPDDAPLAFIVVGDDDAFLDLLLEIIAARQSSATQSGPRNMAGAAVAATSLTSSGSSF